jgi:hypothetical protein
VPTRFPARHRDNVGRLSQVDGPLANDEITYGYDALWRMTSVT